MSNYDSYVDHPRYGRKPIVSGLDVDNSQPGVCLHWHNYNCVWDNPWDFINYRKIPIWIAGTAVEADTTKQKSPVFPITHYYDLDKVCHDCKRPFIFFALEQKYWYEDLGFYVGVNCFYCCECRKKQQRIAFKRKRYEELLKNEQRSIQETLEMIECDLALIEKNIFSLKQTTHVRALLKKIPFEMQSGEAYQSCVSRLKQLEQAKADHS